ncbi:MAG: uroporphyrinogen decarboxylase family protein [Pseudomonadota bacterium]
MSNEAAALRGSMPQVPPPLPESWSSMTGEEKHRYLINGWASTEGKPFRSSEIEEKYKRLTKRWLDAVALKEPDRVPKMFLSEDYIMEYAGCKAADTFYDQEKAAGAHYAFHKEYDSDCSMLYMPPSGRALDLLKYKLIRWPGSVLPTKLPDNVHFQYVEKEYMHTGDYEQMIANPDGYLFRKFFSRIFDGLSGFEMLPTPYHVLEAGGVSSFLMPFAQGSPLRTAFDTLFKAADLAAADMAGVLRTAMRILGDFGTPSLFGSATFAPFDLVGDTMRGTMAVMLDMFRRPDDLVRACEALVPISVQMAVEVAMVTRNPFVIIPLHKGAEGFMSQEQFVKFYWPTFRKQLLAIIDAGLIPLSFAEGTYTKRLDIIAESGLPAGKTVWLFERTDMKIAKEKLGGFACIGGNVPASLFCSGTPQMIKDYCKELMNIAAPGGGFFLSPGAVINQAKPENVRAFVNFK